MPFVTPQRWAARGGDTVALTKDGDTPLAEVSLWGVTARKRLTHALGESVLVQAPTTIDDGARFDLGSGCGLEWTHVASGGWDLFETVPGELAHLPGSMQLSALTIAKLLPSMPSVLRWRHVLEFPKGTRFAYQPPLTAADRADGCVRPPAIVGSYVVKDAAGCKIAHIPRPIAWDRDRKDHVLGSISIANGIEVVAFDKASLATLKPPIRILGLATFGNENTGGTGISFAADRIHCMTETAPEAGTVVSVHAWLANTSGDTFYGGLYDDDSGPNALIAGDTSGEASASNTAHEHTSTCSGSFGAETVWTSINVDGLYTAYYDSDTKPVIEWDDGVSAGTWPDPIAESGASGTANRDYEWYVTYTPASGFVSYPYPLHELTGGIRQ